MQKRYVLFTKLILSGWFLFASVVFADVQVAKEIEAQRIYFGSSKYEISSDMGLVLAQTISLLTRMNEAYTIKLVGYADSSGLEELNQDLSVQRANTVAAYLISQGIDRNRVVIQGLGSEQPIASNETDEGKALNRRVEFKFIVPNTSDLKLVASTAPIIIEEKMTDIAVAPTETPAEAPAAETPPIDQAPLQQTLESVPEQPKVEEKVEVEVKVNEPPAVSEPAKVAHPILNQPVKDTMIAPQKGRHNPYYKNHVYEDRKKGDQGQAYVQIMPLWFTMDNATGLGASENRIQSQPSFGGEAGWSSFVEESYETFFSARVYGNVLRFSDDAATLLSNEKEYTFGGELGLGRYFHPNVLFQIQSGYSREIFPISSGGGITFDNDYIWHAGLSTEWVVWKFTRRGDVGFSGFFNYYDFGVDDFDFGTGYGMDLFVDYDFLRVGFNFSFKNLETKTFEFNSWHYGPTIRLYF